MPIASQPRRVTSPRPATRPALRLVHGRPLDSQAGQTSVPVLRTGRVLKRLSNQPAMWRIELQPAASSSVPEAGTTVSARQATGCLLEPAPGDLVLVMLHSDDTHYVLNILEREDSANRIHLTGDLTVVADHGKLTLQGRAVSMCARDAANIFGKEVTLAGQAGRMRFSGLDLLAKSLDAKIQNVRALGDKVKLAATSLTSRLGRVLRLTGFELHRAKSVRTEVEERFSLQAGQADILAKDEVTVDAEKIHLG